MSTAAGLIARPRTNTDSATTDVVFTLSFATWDAAWRRGLFMPDDRLVQSLLASDRVGRLLICNHARSLPIKLIRELRMSERAPFPTDERTRLVQPLRLRRSDPASISGVERAYAAYDRAILRAVQRHGLQDPVVITSHPLVAGFAELAWARAVTWYAIDDWAEHPAFSRWSSAYRESYSRVRGLGRRVAAVSSVLLERLDPRGPRVLVPNGLDPPEWIGESEPPDWVAELPRPLLVYAGRLDARIDVEWLRTLALAEPAATILLLGGDNDPDHFAALRALNNVHFSGMLARGPLTGIVRSADAGLLPHVSTPLTTAMSPLKLFEYLAAGLPVAATDLPPVREVRHPGVVLIPPGGDYVAGVRAALARGRIPENQRLEFVDRNSWSARHRQMLDFAVA